MKSQIKLGTIFGVELGLHYSWLVIALLITFSLVAQFHSVNRNWSEVVVWTTAIITGILFFACLFAHELSHALVAKARGLPIHKITLFFLGGVAQIEKEASDPKTEFWMAIVGPVHQRSSRSNPAGAGEGRWMGSANRARHSWHCTPGLARLHQPGARSVRHDPGVPS